MLVMVRFARSPARWRPCCGACRSERLLVIRAPRTAPREHAECEDCGSGWDGSALSPAEAADRPPPPPGRAEQFFAEA
jgi:hypothetical protein